MSMKVARRANLFHIKLVTVFSCIVIFLLLVFVKITEAQSVTGHSMQKIKVAFVAGFTGSDPSTANELWRGFQLAFNNTNGHRKI
jgi:hypothetical protein